MKTSKRFISMLLCIVMVASTFAGIGFTTSFEADAAVTLGGITQQRVVGNHEAVYRSYQKRFFGGEETNWPTNFVIPGLGSADDYTPQGMTYWKAKEWILISAYDAGGSDPSVIYALDAVSTNLVALFKLKNANGTYNTGHGGGIAASEHNFYYADDASKVSYIPLSEMDVPVNTVKDITIKDSVDFSKELTGDGLTEAVKTSYCCYDEGVLWTGNFYYAKDTAYDAPFTNAGYPSALMGYKLAGNSSAEEWYYLKHGYNLVKLNKDSTTESTTDGTATYKSYTSVDGANIEIRGNIATAEALGEVTVNFCTVNLTAGKTYKVEYIADNNLTDMYFFAPGSGGHCNVKQSQQSKITDLGNGKYHYQMIFTAGLKPAGADSSWQTSTSVPSSYTGTYTMRFDQDSVPAGGRSFNITDFSVSEYVVPDGITPDSKYEGIGCAGNPTYAVGLDFDKIQYAMVDKGKLYISRSWKRTWSDNHSRELVVADIDLGAPGGVNYPINGRTRDVHLVNYNDAGVLHFGGDNGHDSSRMNQMLYMGEALCVIDDYLYMFGESAAWNYAGKDSSNVCPEPIDVIWKIDQYAIQNTQRSHEDVAAAEYEKVNSLSEINNLDEYIILHESPEKDPVTQDNILYLLDAFGGYDGRKLPKKPAGGDVTQANTGDSFGVIGYEIRDYSVKEEGGKKSLILNAEDDANKSLHWQFESGSSTTLKLRNRDLYFAKHPYFYSGSRLFAMTTSPDGGMRIEDKGNGNFCFKGGEWYNIWCNDGSVPDKISKFTGYYSNHGQTGFLPNYHGLEEVKGTIHVNVDTNPATATAEQTYFQIYKRVTDPYASSYETQVVTDLNAELKSDGTYDITLEAYATNALQYQRVEERPTDFVFVLDVSGSMDGEDATGYHTEFDNWNPLTMKQAAGDNDNIAENGNYNREWTSNFFYRLPDGQFARISVAVNKGSDGDYSRDIWLWCKHPVTGRCYKISQNGYLLINKCTGNPSTDSTTKLTEEMFLENPSGYGYASASEILSEASSDTNRTDYHSSRNSKDKRRAYEVLEYHYTDCYGLSKPTYYSYQNSSCWRILALSQAVEKLVDKVNTEAARTGLAHRVAVVTSGSDGTYVSDNRPWANTGILTNNGNSSGTWRNYTGGTSLDSYYGSAFFNANDLGYVKSYVSHLPCYGHSPINQGLTLASNIINAQKAQGNTYDVNGNRSAVVVVISDGAAGGDNDDYRNATNSNNCANDAIGNGGKKLKDNGAYIFTAQIGNKDYVPNFDEVDFMKYLSSEYTGAMSMTNPGPLNTKEHDYYVQYPVGGALNLNNLTDQIFDEVISNSQNAIAKLTGNAVLREHLTDAFDLTNATITYQTAQSKYDGIGRLYFEKPVNATGFTTSFDKVNNNIEVKGFDYSAKNVSEYNSKNGNGQKLIVTISGVIADADAELENTSINDTALTALYQNSTYMGSNQPVKRFPTYHFSIPEYTYYLDYDIPMYDYDINGTLCSVDSTLQKQSTYKTSLTTGNMGIEFTNNNLDMIYTLNSQAGLTENLSKGYCLIKRDDGTYDWFRLNIVPASTVYYEEDKMDIADGTQSFTEWTQEGTFTGKYQQLSTDADVFGQDEIYANSTDQFSLGTHKEVTVSSANKRSDTQTFTFTGTGFDLFSACSNNTGIQTVTVKKHNADGSMSIVKVFMVDTFYNDSSIGTVRQVPIVQFKGDYGTYTVETTATYLSFAGGLATQSVTTDEIEGTDIQASTATAAVPTTDELLAQVGMDELIGQQVEVIWMDENSIFNGGTGADSSTLSTQAGDTSKTLVNYLDGFRIYNPVDYNDEYIPTEKDATYYSVIDAITAGSMGGDTLAGYLEGGATGSVFADYLKNGGPKYEVYLAPANSVVFNVQASSAAANVMVSVRAASGAPKAKIGTNGGTYTTDVIKSASETYYDITKLISKSSDGNYTITITNDGSGLLAVDNIKLTGATLQPINNVSLNDLNALISTQAVAFDPFAAPTPTYNLTNPPADDPDIDPEGSIPSLEDVVEENKNNNDNNISDQELGQKFLDKVFAFFRMIFEYIKKFFRDLPALLAV